MTNLAILGIFILWLACAAIILIETPVIPVCEEDQVLMGTGEFKNGQWSQYTCGPAVDDYAE